MATAVNVAIRLHLQDGATPALDKAARQAAERAEQAAKRTQRAVDKTEQDQLRGSTRLRSAYEGVSRAREALGVRSEQRIQREIAATEAAFARMSRAGFASELERQRAIDATRAKVEALNREMGRVPPVPAARLRSATEGVSRAREALGVRSEQRIQREIAATEAAFARMARAGFASELERQRAIDATRAKVEALNREMGRVPPVPQPPAPSRVGVRQGLAVGGAAVAAGAAGLAAVRGDFQSAMSVDERIAHLANTAYRERDKSGRIAGKDELRIAVDRAAFEGMGTRDNAFAALDALISSGVVSVAEAIKMLPSLVKAGTAANAEAALLAQIGVRAMQTFKLRADDMPNVLNMALAAGQAGGFELKDMAKWLPQQMAAASMSGMSGRGGFAKLAALNQAAAITAGTKDEAGNNVVNLLAKINSADTANDAKKLGIDLPRYLQEARKNGMDSVDAFGALIERTVGKREDYQALQKQLASVKDEGERRAALESMSLIAQGAGVGKLVQDRQALMALLGYINNKDYMAKVLADVRSADVARGGAVDRNFDVVASTGAARARRAGEALTAGKDRALGDGGSWLGRFNDTVAEVSAKFPVLAGSTAVAATGVTAMAAAAGIATLALGRLAGGAGLAGAAGGLPGRAGVFAGARSLIGKVGPGLALGLGGVAVGAMGGDDPNSARGMVARYGSSALQFAGVGMLAGPVGAAVGAAVGLGFEGLKDAWRLAVTEPGKKAAEERQKLEMQASLKVEFADVNDRLVARIASQKIEARGGDVTLDAGSIWQGAPM